MNTDEGEIPNLLVIESRLQLGWLPLSSCSSFFSNFANCSVSGNRFAAAASCSSFFSIFAKCSSGGKWSAAAASASSFGVNSTLSSVTVAGSTPALSGTDLPMSCLSFIILHSTRERGGMKILPCSRRPRTVGLLLFFDDGLGHVGDEAGAFADIDVAAKKAGFLGAQVKHDIGAGA